MTDFNDDALGDEEEGAPEVDGDLGGSGAETWIFQVAGVRENVWSQNAQTYSTREEAADAARDLLGRWTGADVARVIALSELPDNYASFRFPVILDDERIVVNFRR